MARRTSGRGLTPRLLSAVALVACGCSGAKGTTTVKETYPALWPDVGQLVNHGGALLTSPRIVTVTWAADPNASAFEDFGDKLGTSAFWRTALGEYGVGPASSGPSNHFRVAAAPLPSIALFDLEAWFVTQLTDTATSGWPAWDAQTVYVVYVPTATKLTTLQGDFCATRRAVHADVAVGSQPHVPYVFVDESCNGAESVVDAATEAAGHEIAESATNPHSFNDVGLVDFDATHLAWQLFKGKDVELGDMCEDYADSFFKGPADLPYKVQRLWSNASAAAGHNPCAPDSSDPYFSVTPLGMESVSVLVDTSATPQASLGYRIPVGSSRTVQVEYFSDAATSAPWTLRAVEGDGTTAPAVPQLSITVAKGTGQNGATDDIAVRVDAAGTGTAILMTLISSGGGSVPHYTPVLIGAY